MAHNDSFDEPRFEALYRKLYPDLLRCAEIALRTGGSWYVSVAGRAEEVVQELFAFAWEHQADLWSSASPTGWLYRVLRYKVLELLKEDRFWRKHLIRAAGEMPASPEDDFQQRAEITSILTPEEYEILRKLYLEKYTYEELARELIPWLLEHHFTHVELLPLAEHPFDGSWGYQTTGYFSVTSRYGTPAQFAGFVNACHRMGIGVIMDFVPVHFAANADALAKFDGTYLYEYDSDVGQSEWGTCNFNYYRREVCSFLSSAAGLWMDVYHCDGIRMDAISRALYWQGDPNRGVNQGAVNFLRSLNHGLNERWPTGIYMAEDSTNFLKVTAPTRYEGVGFDYKWDMGWMHDTLDYFATPFGERPGCYGKLLFSMHYFYNELYLLALSHDEVVHGKKTIIDKLWGSYAEKCAQLRTLYFYMYTHPGKKLNFMGNELAHFREWDEKRELDWNLLEYPFHDAFQKYFAALSRTYASEPALYDGEYNPDCFEWVANESCAEGVYAWLRKGRGQNLLCVMNTQDHAHKKFPLYLKFPCSAELVLDTEAGTWGGVHKAHRKQSFHTTDGGVFGRDYTLTLDLPAMGSYLLRLSPEAPNPDAARLSANRALAQKRKAAKAAKAAAEVSDK